MSWQERAVPWHGDHPLLDILEAVEDNPFDRLTEMRQPPSLAFSPYAREQAIAWMRQRKKKTAISLRHTEVFWCMIAQGGAQNNVNFGIDNERAQRVSDEAIIAHVHRIARLMPAFMFAFADPAPAYDEPPRPRLPPLPWCFGLSLKWLHLVPPDQYQLDFTRDVLLNAPAFSVKEHTDGWIELRSFEHLFEYATQENEQRIAKLAQYLHDHMLSTTHE